MNGTARDERFKRLTEAPVYPLLWRMAVPSMVGMAVSSVYSAADTYFVGRLGRTELTAAVGVVFSFISVIQAVGFWFGYGAGNFVSRRLGKGDNDGADRMTSVGSVLAAAVGIVISVLGLMLLRPLAVLLGGGVSEELLGAVCSYLRITLVSVPVMLAANVLYNVLRLQGSARDSMLGMLAGMVLNILLDPLFIITLGMGVAGAAVASLIGQGCGLCVLLFFMGRRGNTAVRIKSVRPTLNLIKEILTGGAPNFSRQGITSLAAVVLNNAAGSFGEGAIAGVTVAMRIITMGYALVIGFGQGFQPICAINYGAGKRGRISAAFRYALLTATGFLIAAAAVFAVGAESVSSLFSDSAEVCRISARVLRAQSVCLPFMAYYILIGMFLQNIGRFGAATLVTVAESGLFLLPLLMILPRAFGFSGLILCKPAAVVVDTGGTLSHAAIVAREYGIPAVLATGNATKRLRDGDSVIVDRTSGTVSIIKASAGGCAVLP